MDARDILTQAISTGAIKPQRCRDCGASKADGHHPDYTKPLEVIWLCRKHHVAEHRRLRLAGIEIPGREALGRVMTFRTTPADRRLLRQLRSKTGLNMSDIVRQGWRALALKEKVR
jgi:hypothetical protein